MGRGSAVRGTAYIYIYIYTPLGEARGLGMGSAVRGGMAEPDRGGGAVRRACAGAPLAGVGKLGPRRRLPPACKGRRQDLCGKRSAPPARRWCGSIIIPHSFCLGLTSRDDHRAHRGTRSAPPTLGSPRRRCGSENRIGAAAVLLELARAGRQEVGAAGRTVGSRPGNLSRAREAAGGLGQQEPSDIICM